MLSDKQALFCEEYLKDLNATQAAIRAGYSQKTAAKIGSENLLKPELSARIQELRLKVSERNELTTDMIIKELMALGFWNIQDFIDAGNTIKDLTTLDRKITRSVVGIEVKETFIPDPGGGEPIKEVTTKLKMVDKRGALVDLGRHLGIFEKDNTQKGKIKKYVVKVTRSAKEE